MEHLEGIMKLADAELESIIKNGKFRSREEIDSVGKLIDLVKDIHCIWEYEEEESAYPEEGMSYNRDGRSMNRGAYRGYYDGVSYARGRRGNVRRDSMGRYSRESRDGYDDGGSYRGYSRDGDTMEHLHRMMDEAKSEQEREQIRRWITEAERK